MADVSANQKEAGRLAHIEPLFKFEDKIAPPHTALLVIDMQNDFAAEGGMSDREGLDCSMIRDMAMRLPKLCDAARRASVLLVFVRNLYSTERNFYLSDVWLEQAARMRKGSYTEYPVCGTGTWGAEFYGNIRPAEHDVVVTKHRFNAFHNTDLDTILRANGIRSLVFSGCVSNVCVESTARDAFMRDYYVILTSDGTAAYTAESHNATLSNIDKYFGEISTIADVCAVWQRCTKSAQGILRP
jgi:ureidoacrylate peracid hydrolase